MKIAESNATDLKQEILSYYDEELEIFQTYLEDLGYSDFTIHSYFYDVKLFLEYINLGESECVELNTVSKRDIASFLRKQHRNAAKSSRNRRLMTLRTFFKSLVKAEYLSYNPALEVDMAKQENGRLPTYLSDKELEQFLLSIAPGQYHIRNRCILMLMSLAGLRVVEVYNLNLSDLIRDEDEPGIEVLGKGNKTRYIPLPIPLYQLLLEYEKMYRGVPKPDHANAFFLSKRGTRISRRRIQEITEETFERLTQQPGFHYLKQKKLSSHKLRHTFGTGMVRDGVDLVTIQQLMGHSNLNTTQIYTHVNNEQKKRAMKNKDVSRFFH
ncbi:tyrosine-type recombinase/integrase [Ornithinibacillus sp. FSL M8-0202]|uniref:tyrosine-type recombinase/integrase n=1 Tax=unclassified Ornithinibacillus TaxID=2620869 RepID=UPI0030CC138D